MTDSEQLTMLEAFSGEKDQSVLSAFLFRAGDIVKRKAFPYGDGTEEVPDIYKMVQVDIASYLLDKRGADGETAHIEGSTSRYYEDGDVPPTLLRRIVPMVNVP